MVNGYTTRLGVFICTKSNSAYTYQLSPWFYWQKYTCLNFWVLIAITQEKVLAGYMHAPKSMLQSAN